MQLNTIKPSQGSKKPAMRVGRGIGCGKGKTCGRGHKGQHSRSGGYHKVGFEGGQMPLQRRVPKFGFKSRTNTHLAEIRLGELNLVESEIIDLAALIKANLVTDSTEKIKVFLSGTIKKAVTVRGLKISKGARAAIEAAGGKVEE